MKKLLLAAVVLAFLTGSCRVFKTNDIYVDHSKEKDHYKVSKKSHNTGKKCNTWK